MMTAIKIWVIAFMVIEGIGVISMLFVDESSDRKELPYRIVVFSAFLLFILIGIGCVGIIVKAIFDFVNMMYV